MAKKFSVLQIALTTSIAVHAALLAWPAIDPEGFNRTFQDTPLEVILVNSRSSEAPSKAQAIAQRNLAGGGEVDRGRADADQGRAISRADSAHPVAGRAARLIPGGAGGHLDGLARIGRGRPIR
jgi:hypothetical protein